ncbi:MAG TPA: FtsX-like permease family protein, partial [Longimicrobiales bacterium]|nr:FtsX-like permease family protein [Longimicrobiales bacterium]
IKLVLVIATAGSVAGILLGIWAGSAMGQMYMEYYRFPYLEYTLRPAVVLTAVTLTTAAAVLGVLRAVGRAVRLAPAEAMRPAPPARYRRTVVERLGLQRLFDQPTRMIMRHLERQPLKAGLAILGISASCAILIMGVFFTDAIDYMIQVQYGIAQRDDLTVTFIEPTSTAAIHEIASLPGVLHVEPFRSVPVRLRNGHREYETAIEGIPPDAYLRRVIDEDLQPITIPAEGMVLATRLAAILGAEAGDSLVVEVLEGSRRTHRVPVVALSEQLIGLGAYMDMTAVNRLAGVGQAVSGAFLMIDHRHEADITDALQDRPRVAAMIAQERAIQSFLDTSASSLLVFTFVLSLFAGVIAFGVIYNSARISLSERSRELASMRVLGFTRGEISYILLGELALLVLLSIPLGFGLGAIGSHAVGASVDNEMYKVPVVLDRGTFGTAALVVLSAAIASALLMRRRLHRLDLIAVLKTRE